MTGRWLIVLLVSLYICHRSVAKDEVPVLVWNTNQSQGGIPAISALQYITYANFQAKYLSTFKPNNILLFLQDALSVEDLTSHATELHNVKHWMESGHSLFLPNVKDAAHLVHDLPAHGYSVLKLDHDAGLNLKQDDKNLVVVELPSTLTNPSRRRALQKADEVMENVISKIGGQRDFTIIFTGRKPSVDDRSDQYEERIRVARSLKAAEYDIDGYHVANCTKLYLRTNITLKFYNDETSTDPDCTFDVPENKAQPANGHCGADFATLMVKYTNVDVCKTQYAKLQITFRFNQAGGSWTLDSSRVFLDGNEIVTNRTSVMDSVPVTMSFSCSETFTFSGTEKFITFSKTDVVLNGFQAQGFQTKDYFDGAWDCVGFFTVPIWCGLLVTLLLVVILTIGMVQLSEIKTMDRFDDPKGQPIMVQASD